MRERVDALLEAGEGLRPAEPGERVRRAPVGPAQDGLGGRAALVDPRPARVHVAEVDGLEQLARVRDARQQPAGAALELRRGGGGRRRRLQRERDGDLPGRAALGGAQPAEAGGVPAAPSAAQARKRRVASARANWARASPSYQSENALRSAASATSVLSGRCGARIAGAPWSSRASPATAIAAHTTRISGNESSASVSGRGCRASASTPVTTSAQASSATIAISAPTAIRAGTGRVIHVHGSSAGRPAKPTNSASTGPRTHHERCHSRWRCGIRRSSRSCMATTPMCER